ncbi:MAG: hypothetical protein ABIJ46_04990 [bacterium]
MANHPSRSGERVIQRKSKSTRASRGTDRKTKSELDGSFGRQARHEGGPKRDRPSGRVGYLTEGGRVVNFGGEVVVAGQFGRNEKAELIALAENVGAAKSEKDPDDRILRLKSTRDGFSLQTANGNLAVAVGKHLHRARKGGSLTIVWSRHDLPVRVFWRPAGEEEGV